MKNLTFIAFLLFIINSSIAQEPWFAKLEGNNAQKVDFPILIDSSYIDNAFKMISEDRALRIDDVKILCPGYDTLTNNRDFFMLNQFAFIDSLKYAEHYEHYLDNEIHEGMVRVSEAFEIKHIKINNNTSLFLWGLYYESYEACPYSSGYYILGTFIHDNKPSSTAILGKDYGAGDAPYFADERAESMINGSAIEIFYKETQGDDEGEESKSKTIEYLLIEGHLIQKAIRK
tara:strand:- start:161 stop:853 length:693 start_codon:yes stop_codon:yes gene_type:complete